MQSPDSQIIVARFFDALARLKAQKVIRGTKTFADRYGINRRNLYSLQLDYSRDIFQTAWLTYLVRDFRVSPAWLLVGQGDFFSRGWDAEAVRSALPSSLKTARKNGIESIPTLFYYRNGERVHRSVGATDRENFNRHIAKMLYE